MPHVRAEPSRETGYCGVSNSKGHSRAWLFLARSSLRGWKASEIQSQLLEEKANQKCGSRLR